MCLAFHLSALWFRKPIWHKGWLLPYTDKQAPRQAQLGKQPQLRQRSDTKATLIYSRPGLSSPQLEGSGIIPHMGPEGRTPQPSAQHNFGSATRMSKAQGAALAAEVG